MQLVVNTTGGFYKHYLRVRRWYGAGEPASRGGLCKPCQTILWGTVFAVGISPLIGIGWLLAKASDRVAGGGGNAVTRRVGRWRVANGNTWAEECGRREFAKAPVPFGAALGSLVLVTAAVAAILVGVFGLGAWHISDIAAWLSGFAAWIGDASLAVGWLVFTGFAHVGLAIGWTAAAAITAGAWAFENHLWLGGWAVVLLTPVTVAAAMSWAFAWFCTNTALGVRLFCDPARDFWRSRKLSAENRKELRKEAAKWPCACGVRNHEWRGWCESCGAELVYGPPGPVTRLSHWIRGRVVAGRMRVMGGGGIAWAFAKGVAKGACPMVEFLSPEEMRERALAAAEEDRAKRADSIGRILGRRA